MKLMCLRLTRSVKNLQFRSLLLSLKFYSLLTHTVMYDVQSANDDLLKAPKDSKLKKKMCKVCLAVSNTVFGSDAFVRQNH